MHRVYVYSLYSSLLYTIVVVRLPFLSEFSDFFLTPYIDQPAKEVPKNIVFWGAPFPWPVKALYTPLTVMHHSVIRNQENVVKHEKLHSKSV